MSTESEKLPFLPTQEISTSENAHKPRFLLLAGGVLVIYIFYCYMQELIFTLKGIPGWYMTLFQFFCYTTFGIISDWKEFYHRLIPIKTYCLLAFLTLGTMSLSNASLEYLNYPTQVIFKGCKLIPVLIGGILIQKKKFSLLDILAALCMTTGLVYFTLADLKVHPKFSIIGVVMICTALLFDAAIGNFQEKAMRDNSVTNITEVIVFSYGIGFCYLLFFLVVTGNFWSEFLFFWEVRKSVFSWI